MRAQATKGQSWSSELELFKKFIRERWCRQNRRLWLRIFASAQCHETGYYFIRSLFRPYFIVFEFPRLPFRGRFRFKFGVLSQNVWRSMWYRPATRKYNLFRYTSTVACNISSLSNDDAERLTCQPFLKGMKQRYSGTVWSENLEAEPNTAQGTNLNTKEIARN